MSSRTFVLTAATAALTFTIACSSSEEKADAPATSANAAAEDTTADDAAAASMDGTWGETALTCDGEPNPKIPQITLAVTGETGTFTLGFGPDCVASVPETYAFNGNMVAITPTSVSCEPSGGCGAVFGGGECLPGPPPPAELEFAVDGDTLTLKKTSIGPPADNCPAGAEELYTMTRQ